MPPREGSVELYASVFCLRILVSSRQLVGCLPLPLLITGKPICMYGPCRWQAQLAGSAACKAPQACTEPAEEHRDRAGSHA